MPRKLKPLTRVPLAQKKGQATQFTSMGPAPTEGQMFVLSLAESIGHAIDRAVDNAIEECAQAAELAIDSSNRDSLVSCTAVSIAELIRKKRNGQVQKTAPRK